MYTYKYCVRSSPKVQSMEKVKPTLFQKKKHDFINTNYSSVFWLKIIKLKYKIHWKKLTLTPLL